jgi:hypothetical protein
MTATHRLPSAHVIHTASGQSNSPLSQNFTRLESIRFDAADQATCQSRSHLVLCDSQIAVPSGVFSSKLRHCFIRLVTISFIRGVNIRIVTLRMSSLRETSSLRECRHCDLLMSGILWNAVRPATFKFRWLVMRRSIFHMATRSPGGPAAAAVSAAVAEVKRLTCSWSMVTGDLSDSLTVRLA